MKKALKKIGKGILKWLVITCLSFTFMFVIVYATQNGGPIEAIYYRASTIDKPIIYTIESTELEEIAKSYQEYADEAYKTNENSNEKIKEVAGLYEKYPVGITLFLNQIAQSETISDLYAVSFIMSFFVGTIIYIILVVLKEIKKKYLKREANNKTKE